MATHFSKAAYPILFAIVLFHMTAHASHFALSCYCPSPPSTTFKSPPPPPSQPPPSPPPPPSPIAEAPPIICPPAKYTPPPPQDTTTSPPKPPSSENSTAPPPPPSENSTAPPPPPSPTIFRIPCVPYYPYIKCSATSFLQPTVWIWCLILLVLASFLDQFYP